MKALFLLASALFLVSCRDTGRDDRELKRARNHRVFYRELPSAALVDELTGYASRNTRAKSQGVVYVELDTLPNQQVTARISYAIYLSEIKQRLPAYFTRLNGDLVLLYPRPQPSYRDSVSRWAFFRHLTRAKLMPDVGPDGETRDDLIPVSFDPEVRLVEIVNNRVVKSSIRRDN
jgi:hypothetical protein